MRCHLRFHLLILLSYVLLSVLSTLPLVVKATEFIPMPVTLSSQPEIHDHWLSLWLFWLAKRALLTLHEFPLFTRELFYPAGVTMPYITTALFPLVASIPFQAAFGLILGTNILQLLFTILAAYGAFLLVHDLSGTDGQHSSLALPLATHLSCSRTCRVTTSSSPVPPGSLGTPYS